MTPEPEPEAEAEAYKALTLSPTLTRPPSTTTRTRCCRRPSARPSRSARCSPSPTGCTRSWTRPRSCSSRWAAHVESTACQGSARTATSRLGQRERMPGAAPRVGQPRPASASLGQLAAREEAGRLKEPCFPLRRAASPSTPPHTCCWTTLSHSSPSSSTTRAAPPTTCVSSRARRTRRALRVRCELRRCNAAPPWLWSMGAGSGSEGGEAFPT